MSYFVFLYEPGAGWKKGKPLITQPFIKAHFVYMERLQAEGKIRIGGAFADMQGALGILQLPSLAEAQATVANDPLVKNSIVRATVRTWIVSVPGTVS